MDSEKKLYQLKIILNSFTKLKKNPPPLRETLNEEEEGIKRNLLIKRKIYNHFYKDYDVKTFKEFLREKKLLKNS